MGRRTAAVLIAASLSLVVAPPARAQEECARAVVFTLPGVTWQMIADVRPENLSKVIDRGSAGSMSVRTNSSRTSYASGFVTLGAGTRTDGGRLSGGVADDGDVLMLPTGRARHLRSDVVPTGAPEIIRDARSAYYRSEASALADALDQPVVAVGNADPGSDPPVPLGGGRWVLLSALRADASVEAAAVGPDLLRESETAPFGVETDPEAFGEAVGEALSVECSVVFIDHGDLARVDMLAKQLETPPSAGDLERALLAADRALGEVEAALEPRDLLLVISPTSPWWDDEVHLGVAVARGPGFDPGSTLVSASTRQDGIVTLPDVAPTLLEHLDVERPSSMLGRAFRPTPGQADRVQAAVDLNDESVFAHELQADISTGFVVAQVILYVIAFLFLTRRKPFESASLRNTHRLEAGALAVVTFPLVSYLQSPIPAHELGVPGFIALLLVLDALAVAGLMAFLKDPLDRLLAVVAATVLVLIGDLVLGTNLQLNAVWGNDPIVAGRFTGLGNIAFTVLGTSSLLTGALLVHRWPGDGRIFAVVIALFAMTVVVDGAPALGSDVGGVLALVPALGITALLLAGRRPTLKTVLLSGVAAILVLGLFLALDLSRPSSERTHLGRLYESVTETGGRAFWDAIDRKISTNLRVFRSTIWTYLMPPALGVMAWLLRRPRGRWGAVAERYPRLRAGLIGGLLLGILGFAVNDSGIVVPAMTMSYLVPLALLLHLTLEREAPTG